VFVHVPVSNEAEAFGQTYVESLKFGIPSVFTLSGIANEIVINEENALVVDFKSTDEIIKAIKRLLNNQTLCLQLVENGKKSVEHLTSIKKTKALEGLYQSFNSK
jgi:glycosyltransferase involved in cell wall biosynthesis